VDAANLGHVSGEVNGENDHAIAVPKLAKARRTMLSAAAS
jgi:hypothetical protein